MFFSYQFYFIFGAFTSLHYQYTVDFIRRHIQAIGISAMLLSIGTIGYFRIWNLKILGLANDQATSPHQPYMLFFDFLTICTIFFVGKQYEAWRDNGMPEWLTTGVSRIAKVSFGMYLNQTIILMILKWLLSMLSVPDWVLLFMLPLGWLSVVYGSFTFAWFCYKVPPFGFLIGRPNFSVRKVVLKQS
nr:acyltransferase [Paucilactobacillus hokkaidonensis]